MTIKVKDYDGEQLRVLSSSWNRLPDGNIIVIGSEHMNLETFCEIAEYVLTNTDLIEGDPRFELVDKIRSALFVDGYNPRNRRIKL